VEKEQLALQALEMYPDKVRFIYHHYPSPQSQFAMKIAEALEAAGDQGKFWEMHDKIIWDTPEDMSELRVLAEEVGLDMDEFNNAVDAGKYTEVVQQARDMAVEHYVKYSALFINQTEFNGSPDSFDNLKDAIDIELAKIAANEE